MDKIFSDYLERIDSVIEKGPYKDTWESLCGYEIPKWFRESKLGIFIHWGVYSVPAYFSEWYPKYMYDSASPVFDYHIKTYGKHKDFGYKDFIPMFKGERFDPSHWAELIKASGARYAVPVAEHHDGFQMYKSRLSHWNAYEMGPKRDVLGELCTEFEKNGIVPCASSHRAEHWFFMGHARDFDSGADCDNPHSIYYPSYAVDNHGSYHSKPEPTDDYMKDWLVRTCEIVDEYRPRLIYFDWWIEQEVFKPYLRKFLAYYYNRAVEWGMEVVVTYKHDAFAFGSAVLDVERGQYSEIKPFAWQSCTAIGRISWGYTADNEFKTSGEILQELADVVSKNGNMLLNIGPRSDGTITENEEQVLREIGRWLDRNGEAIYGAKPWHYFGEGPTISESGAFADQKRKAYTSEDIRYTVNGDRIYAIALKRSEDGRYCLYRFRDADAKYGTVFFGIVDKVTCLEDGKDYPFHIDGKGMHIEGPASGEDSPIAFRISVL